LVASRTLMVSPSDTLTTLPCIVVACRLQLNKIRRVANSLWVRMINWGQININLLGVSITLNHKN
jgi:hypothetical protein